MLRFIWALLDSDRSAVIRIRILWNCALTRSSFRLCTRYIKIYLYKPIQCAILCISVETLTTLAWEHMNPSCMTYLTRRWRWRCKITGTLHGEWTNRFLALYGHFDYSRFIYPQLFIIVARKQTACGLNFNDFIVSRSPSGSLSSRILIIANSTRLRKFCKRDVVVGQPSKLQSTIFYTICAS